MSALPCGDSEQPESNVRTQALWGRRMLGRHHWVLMFEIFVMFQRRGDYFLGKKKKVEHGLIPGQRPALHASWKFTDRGSYSNPR